VNYQANKAGIPSRIFPVTLSGEPRTKSCNLLKTQVEMFGYSAAF